MLVKVMLGVSNLTSKMAQVSKRTPQGVRSDVCLQL